MCWRPSAVTLAAGVGMANHRPSVLKVGIPPSTVQRMNATRPVAIKLDQDTRDRLKRLADAKGRSTHWMLCQAVSQFLMREEAREAFHAVGLQAWNQYQITGLHVTHEGADAWLARLHAGEEEAVPQSHT